jgi:hypothetical protein
MSLLTFCKSLHALKVPIIAIFIIVSLPLFNAERTDAQPITDFNAGRIIDDGVFADYGTMNVSNIQFFLNSKGVDCIGGQAPCLKNYSQDGRSAAQIIFDTSQEFKINPQVLITVLQKEVGLVTDTDPANWQYRTAMGYGCPDSTPGACDSSYYGFTNQVRWAARMYRAIMNASPTWYTPYVVGNNYVQYNPNEACGGTNVYIQNRATQALYNYTPYQPNQSALNAGYGAGDDCGAYGNRNFFLYFRDWFGNPQQSPLVRTPSSPTYYLLTNNKKYAIPSGDLLYAYGLESAPLSVVSDAYLSTIPDGGMLNTIFTNPGDGTVYLADGGKKYGIASGEYCVRWGLACGNTDIQKVVGPEITNMMTNGGVLQSVMKFANTYYLMENGTKQQFMTQKAMTDRGYSSAGSTPVVNWTNATRPFGVSYPENNTFVKFTASSAIYFYSGSQFYAIPNLDIFRAWLGVNSTSYLDTTSSYNTTPPLTPSTLNSLIQSNGTVSLIGVDKKFVLPNTNPSATPLDITNNSDLTTYLSTKTSVQIDDTKALALPNGTIVALKSGTLRPIPTMTDLRMSYSDQNIINIPNDITNAYPVGKLYMIPGRVFRPTDSGGAMYIYGGDGNLWALGTLNELYPALKWNNNIVNTPFSNIDFTDVKIYANLAKINNVPYIVLPDGTLKTVPVGSIANNARVMPLDGDMTKSLHIDSTSIRFIRFDNGTIFQVNANEINPISSLAIYNNLGGNSTNTAAMPLKALDTFHTGNSI